MENYNRLVIEIYKKCFADYKNGSNIDENMLTEAQNKLNFAIDGAKINNELTDELEVLRNDINYLKYELI